MAKDSVTPAMRQWFEIKSRFPNHVLMFRMGDFYEMFYEDAVTAAKVLDIALTARNKGSDSPIPLAGIPHHALTSYLSRFIRAGKTVAICDQLEDPKEAKGVVKRGVTRVVSAGVAMDPETLDERDNNYLMGLLHDGQSWGFAVADLSTGEFGVGSFIEDRGMAAELVRREPAEIIVPEEMKDVARFKALIKASGDPKVSYLPGEPFGLEAALTTLESQFPAPEVEKMDRKKLGAALRSAGGVLSYLLDTQMRELSHINRLRVYAGDEFMVVDEAAKKNLELVATLREGGRRGSLLWLLDDTVTAMGARALKRWILYPLVDPGKINRRHEGVEELLRRHVLRDELRGFLEKVHDLERLCGRISMAVCNARDLVALKLSLRILPALKEKLLEFDAALLAESGRDLDDLGDLRDLIEKAIEDEPPISLRDGGLIKEGYNAERDELNAMARSGKRFLSELEARERRETGIPTLKIRYNRIFGYSLEISNVHKDKVPDHYIRKQTLVNAERYITQELKEYEEKILNAQERIVELEYNLFAALRSSIAESVTRIQEVARVLSTLDILVTFARLAETHNYKRPKVDDSSRLEIEDGRHPVVERTNPGERFIPNDTLLDVEENQLLIITGPNMAGKSTYIRQVALITLMAQIGSFVPVASAHIGVVDRIFTRVGASDNLSRGESTFMVEMKETADILHQATCRSLIILDEIGRGTSTFDGLSIAWAVTEYLHDNPERRARTLFATHYHELVDIAREKSGVKNFNVSIIERNDQLIFLHKIRPGVANRSYGIEVARMAGLPVEVIERAKEIMANLETGELDEVGRARLAHHRGKEKKPPKGQLSLFFTPRPSPVIMELRDCDPMAMSPLEAINFLAALKEKVEKE